MTKQIIVDLSKPPGQQVRDIPFTAQEEADLARDQAAAAILVEQERIAREKEEQLADLKEKARFSLLDEEAKNPAARQEIKDWDMARRA